MMKPKHPYHRFESTELWAVLDRGIADLVDNGDLTESTPREYIVGYLTKLVREHNASDAGVNAQRAMNEKRQAS